MVTTMRFFFDYATDDRSLFDYRGEDFRSHHSAIEFAAIIAQHLKNSLSGEWNGWSIEIRNADGTKLCSLPVDSPDLNCGTLHLVAS
jgi:hypothetical protein